MATTFSKDPSATMDPNHLHKLIEEQTGLVVTGDIDGPEVNLTVLGDVPQNKIKDIQDIIDAYEYDPDWNRPALKRLKELRDKDSLTPAEAAEATHLFLKQTVVD